MRTISELFKQLGLPGDTASVDAFVEKHGPLMEDSPLDSASFWRQSQRDFIKEKFEEDADWVFAIDELNLRLHKTIPTD